MPVGDPGSGRTFIWLITCLLFISLIAGGACLLVYLTLPDETAASSWIPIAGVTLVCLPWGFWFCTCLYRLFSRCCGYRARLGIADDNNNGGSNWAGSNKNASTRNIGDVEGADQSNKGELNRVSSVASRESEMALTKSMNS